MAVSKTKKAKRKRRSERKQIYAAVKHQEVLHDDTSAQPVTITAMDDGEGDQKSRPKFSMVAYTGGPMRPGGWYASAPLILDIVGMTTSNGERIPIHRDHDMGRIVGHTTAISRTASQIRLTGVVSAMNDHSREVVDSSREGFPWQASVGATLLSQPEFVAEGDTVHVNGRKRSGPVYVARKWLLFETSFLSMGADPRTSAVAASFTNKDVDMNFSAWLKAQGFTESELSESQLNILRAAYDAENNQEESSDTESQSVAATATDTAGNGETAATAAGTATIQAERDRVDAEWREAAARRIEQTALIESRLPTAELRAQAIREDWSNDRIELEALRASASRAPAIHSTPDTSQTPRYIEAGLMLNAGVANEEQAVRDYGEQTVEAARRHVPVSAGLKYLVCEFMRAHGRHVHPGAFDQDTISAAYALEKQNIAAGAYSGYGQTVRGSGFSTISLSGTLSNLANKRMLTAFMAVNRVSQRFCSQVGHNDFKTNTKYDVMTLGRLEDLAPTGEIKHTTMGEESYTNKLETRARMIALPRQLMINDDLGAFLRVPAGLGRMSAETLEYQVFKAFLDNTDGFFDATPPAAATWQPNALAAGASSALSTTSLESAHILFQKQTDQDGRPILVTPSILLVQPEQHQDAINLTTKTTVTVAGDPTSGEQLRVGSEFVGMFDPVSSPYISNASVANNSATAWWLLSDPTEDFAVMEIAYLNNRRVPYIDSSDVEFNQLGMQFRAYFDFGIAKFSNRAGVYSPGA